jgi:putative nucleotidyltransferase with HDIG domain
MLVNVGLLSLAISLADGQSQLAVWRERFRWLTPYYLTAGPLAVALVVAYETVGITGLMAFMLPPAMMMFSTRQYVSRTRQSVEEVRAANEELRDTNAMLAERNEDLQALFQFAGGLSALAHDRASLTGYAEQELTRLTGARAEIALGDAEGGIGLVAGGSRIGGLHLAQTPGFEGERWNRLRDAILPQLATAIESANLVEQERKLRLETIAALARSMEAKDYYTGGHTERVATVAVALARRLGFAGADVDAIEIGALLHDIGKIGIPERILHKPGPLDDDEWKVMKEHPVISEYILSEVDLHPVVCQIARSSHERMDGAGYPDGLVGNEIPLAARIVLVADAFDALTSDRPYRRGRRVREAVEELREHTGSQFCPTVIEALELLYREEPHVLAGGKLRAISAA